MRKAKIFFHAKSAGVLAELDPKTGYRFQYDEAYEGPPISLTLPVRKAAYEFDRFPPFLDGLLPEGEMLEGLLRQRKIDRTDFFSQLVAVGQDLVGAITVEECP